MIIWTHRGNPGPENTLEAFAEAWKAGIRNFETDIHVTRDGVLVLSHDPSIKRLTGMDKKIVDLTFEELNQFSIRGLYDWCTLDALVAAFPNAQISIDIKSEETLDPFINWLFGKNLSNFIVGSFSTKRVETVRKHYPEVATALTQLEVLKIRFGLARFVRTLDAKRYAMVPRSMYGFEILTGGFFRSCNALSIDIYCWVVNSSDEALELVKLGAKGIVTDDYNLFI